MANTVSSDGHVGCSELFRSAAEQRLEATPNTLGTAMFDSTTHLLTDSGRAHLRWIVTDVAQDRRVLLVLQGLTQQETAQALSPRN